MIASRYANASTGASSPPSLSAWYTTSGTAHDRLKDGGFESPRVPLGGLFQPEDVAARGCPWALTSGAGLLSNHNWIPTTAPEGTQSLYVEVHGSASQSVNFTGGSYAVSFQAAQSPGATGHQDFVVKIDGAVVTAPILPTSTSYAKYTTAAFTVSAGTHTLTIGGLNTAGGDGIGFVDDVKLLRFVAPVIAAYPIDTTTGQPANTLGATFTASNANDTSAVSEHKDELIQDVTDSSLVYDYTWNIQLPGDSINFAGGGAVTIGSLYSMVDNDLHFAIGNAGLIGLTLKVKATKTPAVGGGFKIEVGNVILSGQLTDVYDFAYDEVGLGGALAHEAAQVEAGYGTLGSAGRVAKVEVNLNNPAPGRFLVARI